MRERVYLFGDLAARPDGLERALMRAGFALAEGGRGDPISPPDLAVMAVQEAGPELDQLLAQCRTEVWGQVPVVVLLAGSNREDVARALAQGAADALAAPIHLGELCARLETRLKAGAELRRAAGAGALKSDLIDAIEEIAGARRPEEMLETMTRRLGTALAAAHCACLAPSPDRRYARIIAVHENPTLRDVAVDLFRYPEVVEAAMSGRTVHAPEVLRDGLFLAHLAQWPDSPEVHEIESAAAVPLITQHSVRALVVIRTRRGDPPLGPDQVSLVEQLVNATAALLEREERRAEVSRRQSVGASTDPLTGCANLDALDYRLREELERVRRYGGQCAFALLDVDALRDLNTRLGREVGDRFLRELGFLLLHEIRTPDFVARYGSDEFALLMPSTGIDGARQLLGRISARLASHPFDDLVLVDRPKLAAGLVIMPHQGLARVEDLLPAAEAALVRGKNNAPDRVGLAAAVAA
ncbi:MAG TPA: GGDEF domain-containing protein [Gemmatimonadales bacterium]|nr:GGDEF domain-containing protein [Gemmatimonadales bacterium]